MKDKRAKKKIHPLGIRSSLLHEQRLIRKFSAALFNMPTLFQIQHLNNWETFIDLQKINTDDCQIFSIAPP